MRHSFGSPGRLAGAAVATLVLSAACQQDLTSPARARGVTAAAGPRRDIQASGTTVTATTDDGATTLTVDDRGHTLTINNQSYVLTPEAADSLYLVLMRARTAEQQALYVRSGGKSGGGVPKPPPRSDDGAPDCPSGRQCMVRVVPPETGALNIPGARGPATGAPVVTTASTGATRTLQMQYDPGTSCLDVSKAIYDEMPRFRTAKDALLVAIKAAVVRTVGQASGMPPTMNVPSTWLGVTSFYGAGPMLDLAMAEFEDSRLKLGMYAVLFNMQDCLHADNPRPVQSAPGGGGSNGSPTAGGTVVCLTERTLGDDGTVINENPLGCYAQ